jgi:hypothetical protein
MLSSLRQRLLSLDVPRQQLRVTGAGMPMSVKGTVGSLAAKFY